MMIVVGNAGRQSSVVTNTSSGADSERVPESVTVPMLAVLPVDRIRIAVHESPMPVMLIAAPDANGLPVTSVQFLAEHPPVLFSTVTVCARALPLPSRPDPLP